MANLRFLKKEIDYRLEEKNASLVRKHYAQLRSEMVEAYGKLFEKLSALNK